MVSLWPASPTNRSSQLSNEIPSVFIRFECIRRQVECILVLEGVLPQQDCFPRSACTDDPGEMLALLVRLRRLAHGLRRFIHPFKQCLEVFHIQLLRRRANTLSGQSDERGPVLAQSLTEQCACSVLGCGFCFG